MKGHTNLTLEDQSQLTLGEKKWEKLVREKDKKRKSPWGQSLRHSHLRSYIIIYLLSYFQGMWILWLFLPNGLTTSHHGWMYISEACDTLTVCEIDDSQSELSLCPGPKVFHSVYYVRICSEIE